MNIDIKQQTAGQYFILLCKLVNLNNLAHDQVYSKFFTECNFLKNKLAPYHHHQCMVIVAIASRDLLGSAGGRAVTINVSLCSNT